MPETCKKYDREFREGAVRIVEETGRPIAQVARDLGVNEGALGNWVAHAQEGATYRRGDSRAFRGPPRRRSGALRGRTSRSGRARRAR
jgi:transposase-like protein